MKRTALIFIAILPYGLYAALDFGKQGKTYPIKEMSIKKQIQEGIEKLDKEELKKKYFDAIDKSFKTTVTLSTSDKDFESTFVDYILASYDIPDPNKPGQILYKKGDKIISVIPKGKTLQMCFIDGTDNTLAIEVAKEFGKCDYLVANKDIRTINYLEGNLVFPMGKAYIERFGIDVLPTKLIMNEDKITKIVLDMNRIKKKVLERK